MPFYPLVRQTRPHILNTLQRIFCAVALVSVTGFLGSSCATTQRTPSYDLLAPPHLPSPTANIYRRVPSQPTDALVGGVIGDHSWDEALSGAASGLALATVDGNGGLHAWEIREALWQAGYPYPVESIHGWSTLLRSPPSDEIINWAKNLPLEKDLGMVRARSTGGEAWIALVAQPRAHIGPQPRELATGNSIGIPAVPDGKLKLGKPNGEILEFVLDAPVEMHLNTAGEWLVQIYDSLGVLAHFPIYVGIPAPTEPVFSFDDSPMPDSQSALARTQKRLGEIREAYGASPWQEDLLLQSAAPKMMLSTTDRAQGILGNIGFSAEDISALRCEAPTVEDCLDSLLWEPDYREDLLITGRYLGIGIHLGRERIRLLLLIGRAPAS